MNTYRVKKCEVFLNNTCYVYFTSAAQQLTQKSSIKVGIIMYASPIPSPTTLHCLQIKVSNFFN